MRFLKVGAVVLGALVVTTLGISASDVLSGKGGSLLGMLVATEDVGVCPKDMVHVPTAASFTCIDKYEASAGVTCPMQTPVSSVDTQSNLNEQSCVSTAAAAVQPWTYVTREQAATLCARAGKRLPTAQEWYMASIGTPDDAAKCNTETRGIWPAGSNESCVAATGIYDAVGNVWEWVLDDVRDSQRGEIPLPPEGYVVQVDSAGVPSLTDPKPSELFYDDYFWSESTGVFGMLRGGFYASESDGGLYAVQARTAPTSATVAIGFRCVQ
jgi:formylglycine-generating enzyme required for sulfatase activity